MEKESVLKRGISGSTLKIIACIIMLIDHIGAVVLEGYMATKNYLDDETFFEQYGLLYNIDFVIRLVGRIAFPIFCFLLIEGFVHTRNVRKYAMNLGIFALISEIPFNFAFATSLGEKLKFGIFYPEYQSVFFTLFLGLLVLCGCQYTEKIKEKVTGRVWGKLLSVVCELGVLAAGILMAELLKTDYSGIGILTIYVMYRFRNKKSKEMACGCAVLTVFNVVEITSFLALPLIRRYNGERGLKMKYFFYAFYPVHLLILYAIARLVIFLCA